MIMTRTYSLDNPQKSIFFKFHFQYRYNNLKKLIYYIILIVYTIDKHHVPTYGSILGYMCKFGPYVLIYFRVVNAVKYLFGTYL